MMISSVFALAISHSIRSTGFPGIIFSGINRLIDPRKAYGRLRKGTEGYVTLFLETWRREGFEPPIRWKLTSGVTRP